MIVCTGTPLLTPSAPEQKIELRRSALARRDLVGSELRGRLTQRLLSEGLRLVELWRPDVTAGFHPIRQEPDVTVLFQALADRGLALALPVVTGWRTHLDFRLWRPGEPTAPGPMGIQEPLDHARSVDPDLLFVPLACFDRRGGRVGYGAGFYDRTLARLRAMKPVRAVGVAYGLCEVASAPYEAHDERLDAVVTERETIFVSER